MKILVVGAGLAGLYKAYKLVNKKNEVLILEKSEFLGGQLRTIKYQHNNQNYYFDIGPHIPPKNYRDWNKLCSFIDSVKMPIPIKVQLLIKKDLQLTIPLYIKDFISMKKKTLFYLLKFIPSFIFSSIIKRKENNLEDALKNAWGSKFYSEIMFYYISNFWKYHPVKISKNYKARFSPPKFKQIINEYIENFVNKNKSSAARNLFLYPTLGVGTIVDYLKGQILNLGGKIKTNSHIRSIIINEKEINIEYLYEQQIIKKEFDKVFWTGSIHDLAKILKFPEYHKFRYIKLLNINFSIKKKDLLGNKIHTSYIMIPGVHFHRIYEPKKFSKKMAPNNKTSGCLEITLEKIPKNLDNIIEKSLEQFNSIFNIDTSKINYLGHYIYDYAYPLMFKEYEKYLANFKLFIQKKHPNFFLIGRTGLHFPINIERTIKSTYPPYSFS